MRIWQWTLGVVEVGVGAEAEELPQGASLARLLPGNTQLTSCMTATLPPIARSLMARGYIKSGWLTSTPRLRGQRLQWVCFNQTTLRADQYKGMVDAMQQDGANSTNFGRMVVLPATFVGIPCHMNQLYQDSMALVRKFGKPDLFITMTCNPNWPEILHELKPGEEANDHPDLTSRVFNMKLNALLKNLLHNGVLGTAVADIHVVEWQKWGLPHGHILIILRS